MRAWPLPLSIGGAAMFIGAAFSWVPSFWWDEAATISAANRSVGALFDLHALRDAVHGLHNLLLHWWFSLVGISEFTSRIPGAVALGVGAAAVTATGQKLSGRRVAVVAGLLFAITPRVTWAATEARSYAFAIAGVSVLTLLLVTALTTGKARWWVPYVLLVTVSTVMFVYTATVILAHAVTVLVMKRDRMRFGVAAAVGLALSGPFVVLAASQVRQVSWIPPLDGTVTRTILVDQWFPQAPWAAALCAVIVVAGAVVAVRTGVTPGERMLLRVALPGFAVPMTVLLVYSLVVRNLYLDRYLSFTVPAMVLLVGWALARLATRWWTMLVVFVALVVAVSPAYIAQRQPYGKAGGMDYSAVADRLVEVSEVGDCVAFEPTVSWAPTSPRALMDARPDAVAGLDDVGFGLSAVERTQLWSTDVSPSELARRASTRCTVLWVIADRDRETAWKLWHPNNVWWRFEPYRFIDTDTFRELAAGGFEITAREPVHRLQLIRLEPAQTQ
ncbi:glycosyltransferase family 39 protein [Rhodococcus artemisiae]|uniref:Glycosyltransferase family 39 protein n=1 Tax=Rhodococcus artemisiae TaxID=714159 RepID=A0ABU7LAB8_9NOCA|nr:glycosyltransferase family 39 protein [Rhodococcus artemisiae]MEE2058244.1 glycosyltransferase family 39 protein [Rhodococcus artemisiae]